MKKYLFLFLITQSYITHPLQLTSPAFKHNGTIPEKYTCDGENISPELRWSGVPKGTKSFVLLVEDPDATKKVWVHWLLFNIPEWVDKLPENSLTGQFVNGATDFQGSVNYGGPCPPSGTHRYEFTLFALDTKFELLRPRDTKKQVLDAMRGHVLDRTTLMGKYTKKNK